jgi:hypothetical protein
VQLPLPRLFHLLHHFQMPRPIHPGLFRRTVQFRVEIATRLDAALRRFGLHWVSFSPWIISDAGHLPRHLDIRFISFNGKFVSRNLAGDDGLCKLS